MDMNQPIEAFRTFILGTFEILAPVLIITFLVAIIIGAIQAMMQIQEQSLSFLPKLLVMFGVLYYLSPWMLQKLVELMSTHIDSIKNMW